MSETTKTEKPATRTIFVLQIKDMSAFSSFPGLHLYESVTDFMSGMRDYMFNRCTHDGEFASAKREQLFNDFMEFLGMKLDAEVAGVFQPEAEREWKALQDRLYAISSERIQISLFIR